MIDFAWLKRVIEEMYPYRGKAVCDVVDCPFTATASATTCHRESYFVCSEHAKQLTLVGRWE